MNGIVSYPYVSGERPLRSDAMVPEQMPALNGRPVINQSSSVTLFSSYIHGSSQTKAGCTATCCPLPNGENQEYSSAIVIMLLLPIILTRSFATIEHMFSGRFNFLL